MEDKKETAQEVRVQEQYVKLLVQQELRKYKIFQTVISIIQCIAIAIIAIEVI